MKFKCGVVEGSTFQYKSEYANTIRADKVLEILPKNVLHCTCTPWHF